MTVHAMMTRVMFTVVGLGRGSFAYLLARKLKIVSFEYGQTQSVNPLVVTTKNVIQELFC